MTRFIIVGPPNPLLLYHILAQSSPFKYNKFDKLFHQKTPLTGAYLNIGYLMMCQTTVSRNGTLLEVRKREYYVKPGIKKRLKRENARKLRRSK